MGKCILIDKKNEMYLYIKYRVMDVVMVVFILVIQIMLLGWNNIQARFQSKRY